jgi:hypothetical protein
MTNFLINIGIPKAYAGDIALLLLMILAGVALMFIVKKTKIGAFAFAVYAAYLITEVADFDFIDTYTIKSGVFLIIAIGLHYILFKPTVVVKLGGGSIMRWVKRIAISFTIVGLMATIVLGWIPGKEVVKMLSPFGLKMFTTSLAQFVWAIAPMVVLIIARKREE